MINSACMGVGFHHINLLNCGLDLAHCTECLFDHCDIAACDKKLQRQNRLTVLPSQTPLLTDPFLSQQQQWELSIWTSSTPSYRPCRGYNFCARVPVSLSLWTTNGISKTRGVIVDWPSARWPKCIGACGRELVCYRDFNAAKQSSSVEFAG